ncbi:MAG: thioredoxin domain-containing protein [Gammaproteobacteria bacterium]
MSKKKQSASQRPENSPTPAGGSAGRRGLFIGGLIVAGVALVAAAYFYIASTMTAGGSADTSTPTALESTHSPSFGDPAARVHIVEFMDPACETCALFYPAVKRLVAENAGRVRVSIRHVPFHEGSGYAVRLLEASRNQDRYWQTLEALLASQANWAPNHVVRPALVREAVAGVGLDMARLQADMDSQAVVGRAERDLADARALKLKATPEFFVNGRPLPSFGWEQLQTLVREELARAYP